AARRPGGRRHESRLVRSAVHAPELIPGRATYALNKPYIRPKRPILVTFSACEDINGLEEPAQGIRNRPGMSEAIAIAPGAPGHGASPLTAALERLGEPLASRRRARERRLAHDLVELSRLDHGLERAEPVAVDLALLLRAATADYAG